jgi:hypothetical protein
VGRAGAISTLPQLCADRKTAPFSTYLLYYRARLKALVPKAVRVMRIVCESPAFDVFSGFHIQRRLVHTLKTRNSPAGDPREGSEPETGSHPATGHFGTKRKRVAGMRLAKGSLRLAWRMGVFVLGTVLLGAGIVMIVTPGPAVVFIPLGLGVLATDSSGLATCLPKRVQSSTARSKRPRTRRGRVAAKRHRRRQAPATVSGVPSAKCEFYAFDSPAQFLLLATAPLEFLTLGALVYKIPL